MKLKWILFQLKLNNFAMNDSSAQRMGHSIEYHNTQNTIWDS